MYSDNVVVKQKSCSGGIVVEDPPLHIEHEHRRRKCVQSRSQNDVVSYKARDGLTINGYLTLPKGVASQNLPVVVNPHGGPWAPDAWGFNPEVQMLANCGYAVFQPNFRGSVGYGRKFWEASFKQWGRTMQDDITDGVNWLVKEGIAVPKKIAIYGGSYGAYATPQAITSTPDLYAAAIDYVGVEEFAGGVKKARAARHAANDFPAVLITG